MPDAKAPAAPARALANPAAFYATIRSTFGGTMTTAQVTGCAAKLAAFGAVRAPLAFVAYALATSFHETSQTMQPVPEIGRGRGCAYGQPGCHAGQIAYGRGDVQLTWDYNYARADRELGLNGALIANYALALRPDISAQIMVRGMTEGWFTGKRLVDYLPASGKATLAQFVAARRIINGTDRAQSIAAIALNFQDALVAGGWA